MSAKKRLCHEEKADVLGRVGVRVVDRQSLVRK